ncbi:MAG: cytochrome c oxidase subunit II [Porphyromonadaceae bacterium CG2_30_38_12]|nr:MAG: cytochrome c oxidase subunit II [Porphyromonadaceae bacterium CG2_30_38_12]
MFSNASNFVQGVDMAFAIIVGISLFFLITLTGTMIYFVVRYDHKKHPEARQIKDNKWMEATWITIPLILVLYMFYIGWEGFIPMRQAPKDAMQITAIGKMWKYEFQYEGNKVSDTLVIPINKAVKISLKSVDVLHGFSVPSFRIKEDMVPVKDNYTWFIPGELGDFDLFCTVYCGLNHAYMHSIVRVVPEDQFNEWVAYLPEKNADAENPGYKVMEKNGCFACHNTTGTRLVGPSFKGIYGRKIKVMTDGVARELIGDDSYVETSIYEPNKDISDGYPANIMQSYKNSINKEDMKLIQEYIKTLK